MPARGRPCRSIGVPPLALTVIDAAGKAYLAAMHRQGASFVAGDCLTRSIVEEITQLPTGNGS